MSLAEDTGAPAPFKPLKQKPPKITVKRTDDGTFYISSDYSLPEMKRSVPHIFEERAALHPDRNFIAERDASGEWRYITYGEANAKADAVASALLARGLDQSAPLMILSSNSIAHAVMALGAMKAGVPVAPVSVPYSLMSSDFSKLRHVVALTKPKMIFADHGDLYAKALAAVGEGAEIVTQTGSIPGATSYDDLLKTNASPDVRASMEKIGHDTVAKYLFTSGSTGMPKGVIQTHRMMMAQIAAAEALRSEEPDPNEIPQSLEWMPWNHISAGNIGFNGNMNAGGTVYLDAGKPVPGMFDQTIRNPREVSPRVFGSAPVAFAACTPLVQDAVVCGLDKPYIALLAWPNIAAARKLAGLPDDAAPQDAISHPKVAEHLRTALQKHNKSGGGSSTRIARIHLMLEPPSIDGHEIADKGYVNQAATAARRAPLVERLYQEPAPEDVIVV